MIETMIGSPGVEKIAVPLQRRPVGGDVVRRITLGEHFLFGDALRELIGLRDNRIVLELIPREGEERYVSQALVHLQFLVMSQEAPKGDYRRLDPGFRRLCEMVNQEHLRIAHLCYLPGGKEDDLTRVSEEFAERKGFRPANPNHVGVNWGFQGLFVPKKAHYDISLP